MIQDVEKFLLACGQTNTGYNIRQTALYTGLQCEELAEKLEVIFGRSHAVVAQLHIVGEMLKSGQADWLVETGDRVEMLDADMDLVWVSLGAALSIGAEVPMAWSILTESNMSKIDPATGYVTKDANGKVVKPPGFKRPNFASAFLTQP